MAILLQRLTPLMLLVVAGLFLPAALFAAARRCLAMVRRARWLLLSILVLFALATPGERLPEPYGDWGVTVDGLVQGGEHALRLVLLLASLAWLHEALGTDGILAGLYWLLGPIGSWRNLRERFVVRLMLVLDAVETGAGAAGWRSWLAPAQAGPEVVTLARPRAGRMDWVILSGLVLALAAVWLS